MSPLLLGLLHFMENVQ